MSEPFATELAFAIMFASRQHNTQLDKGGQAYILHPLRVMQSVLHHGNAYGIVAVCHDTIEDCFAGNYEWGFTRFKAEVTHDVDVVRALNLLTHRKEQSYSDYIKAIKMDEIATAVKLADLQDNSDIRRLKGVTEKDLQRMKKYHKAYLYLTGKSDDLDF